MAATCSTPQQPFEVYCIDQDHQPVNSYSYAKFRNAVQLAALGMADLGIADANLHLPFHLLVSVKVRNAHLTMFTRLFNSL